MISRIWGRVRPTPERVEPLVKAPPKFLRPSEILAAIVPWSEPVPQDQVAVEDFMTHGWNHSTAGAIYNLHTEAYRAMRREIPIFYHALKIRPIGRSALGCTLASAYPSEVTDVEGVLRMNLFIPPEVEIRTAKGKKTILLRNSSMTLTSAASGLVEGLSRATGMTFCSLVAAPEGTYVAYVQGYADKYFTLVDFQRDILDWSKEKY